MARYVGWSRRAREDFDALEPAERERVATLLTDLRRDRLPESLDVKPLEGAAPWFRARVGDLRLIYRELERAELAAIEDVRGETKGFLVARVVRRKDLDRAVKNLSR